MPGPRPVRRGILGAATAATAALILSLPATATAAMAASASTTPTSTALPGCDVHQLHATQNHVGTVAEVSSIDEMDTVTVTIGNDGPECSRLGAALYFQTVRNSVTLVWPEVFWRIDDRSWMSSSVETVSCQAPPGNPDEVCALATLPGFPPMASGTTTLDVALYFTSWDDANYAFSGSIAPNDDGGDLNINEFGPGSTNDWLLNCATCVNTGTTILPPGNTGNSSSSPPLTGSAGRGRSRGPGSSAASAGAVDSSGSTGPSSSASSSGPESSSSVSAAAIGSAASPVPSISAATLDTAAVTAASSGDSLPVLLGMGMAAVVVLGGGGLFLARRQRSIATAGNAPEPEIPNADTPGGDGSA